MAPTSRATLIPNPVVEAHVIGKSSNSVSIAWTPPIDNGAGISGYLLEYLPEGGNWTTFGISPDASGNQATINGLQFSTAYEFRVSVIASDTVSMSTPVIAIYPLSKIVSGGTTGCELSQDGYVQCWGNAGYVGDGTGMFSVLPHGVLLPEKAIDIASGVKTDCAVGASGSVYCWGFNDVGQLGNGSNQSSLVPVQAIGITNAVKVAVGGDSGESQSCAITSDNQAYCWGNNNEGQLGIGNTSSSLIPMRVPAPPGIGYTDVTAGGYFTCFLGTDTNVYCTGDDTSGQLGIGNVGSFVPLQP